MKKQTLLIIALILTVVLSACGSSAPQTPAEPVAATEAAPQLTEEPTATESTVPATDAANTPAADNSTSTGISFANDVQPILNARCIKCHGVERVKEGLDLQSYDNLIAGSNNGPVIEAGNADNSLFVQLIVEGEMPNRGDPVTPAELQLITDWVNQGALNN